MKLKEEKFGQFIRLYYLIGAIGFILPFTERLFEYLTPWGLLLNLGMVVWFENERRTNIQDRAKFYLFITGVYLFTFLIEMAGVQTGVLFGNYIYAGTLGIKIAGTPLIIGVNWVLVFLGASQLVSRINTAVGRILLTAALMTGFDLLMEQVAPSMGMWHFESGVVPLRNYLAWFVISGLISTLKELLRIDIRSGLSRLIFICQFLFFAAIFVARYIQKGL